MDRKKELKRKFVRALVLFSGGLDSILAVKILEGQGISVTALVFESYFFDAREAKKSAQKNKIRLSVQDFSSEHFKIVKNPRFGRGAGMNPCVDCHLLMLKIAKKIAAREKFDFIATGEVLGQRPMSQNARALLLIEKKTGLEKKVLRPLSARVLPETKMEKEILVDREKLSGISGRSRKEQMVLANKYKIKYFPTPAGGCILTDKEYSKKLKELIEKIRAPKKSDLEVLRIGRNFWSKNTKIILGRNHEENLALKKLAETGDALIELKDIPGPTALIRGKKNRLAFGKARDLLLKYTKSADGDIPIKITEV